MATIPRARIMLRTSGPRKTVNARARISAGTESITSNAPATNPSTSGAAVAGRASPSAPPTTRPMRDRAEPDEQGGTRAEHDAGEARPGRWRRLRAAPPLDGPGRAIGHVARVRDRRRQDGCEQRGQRPARTIQPTASSRRSPKPRRRTRTTATTRPRCDIGLEAAPRLRGDSSMTDPWVEDGVEEVDDEVDERRSRRR